MTKTLKIGHHRGAGNVGFQARISNWRLVRTFKTTLGNTILLLLASTMTAAPLSADPTQPPVSQAPKDCRTQAKHYLDERKPTQISHSCFSETLAAALPNAIQKLDDGKSLVFGSQNLLYIQAPSPTDSTSKIQNHIVAGKHTHLKTITAITLDKINQDVIVLDGLHGVILPFSLTLYGNVASRRTLKNRLLIGATGVAVDPTHDELLISNNTLLNVQIFSRLADIDGHQPSSTTSSLRIIEGSLTQITSAQSLAVDGQHNEIFLLDQDANQLLTFDRTGSGNVAPKRVVRGSSTLLSKPTVISYNKTSDTLDVTNGDGSIISFPRTSSGNTPPL